ncbi:Whi2p NDAI_0F00730 [Naumovozyma dairenensis CBS 421]|uniref:Growth regulation protein n=1 Tax=Naumovozyma dairenensis (strain ATCC 10597 / BCRC 20456 / CBS 421 / NBRC 0211 / NRRL Y-12639) TaxID=1071378 RepID=G0WC81_NAUDC|nr:hypothetical protein NDAI_0F00730 [Naumovozyma dairenensis CBS 421]CCD25392.1 hypothetical protein NDAI_0F00730 [Naumovozyma dairenensis CBS 421]
MSNFITQVSQDRPISTNPIFNSQGNSYSDNAYNNNGNDTNEELDKEYGDSLIHLNIQENHYFITRDQLMSLPESLLLCLFPSGVFLDRSGQVITNLSPDDEVFIMNFPPDCFEYIMEVYTRAHDDLINYPVETIFDKSSNNKFLTSAKGFFGFGTNNSQNNTTGPTNGSGTTTNEHDLLHQKPAIIVLREDLDYYCVPQEEFQFEPNEIFENKDDLLQHFMGQIKLAAGSYLTEKTSIFQGLYSSNRLKSENHQQQKEQKQQQKQHSHTHDSGSSNTTMIKPKLGPAEQHLMDMLCSSGFKKESQWGNRTQEPGKTVISSLSLCRLANESTQEFRELYENAKKKWELQHSILTANDNDKKASSSISLQMLGRSSSNNFTNNNANSKSNNNSNNNLIPLKSSATVAKISNIRDSDSTLTSNNTGRGDKRKSRLATLADNVRSRSTSRNSSLTRTNNNNTNSKTDGVKIPELPKLYDLVPKPDINVKLLLFWRKPARKCWWGEEDIELDVEIYGDWIDKSKRIIGLKLPSNENAIRGDLNMITVPIRLHIRRVWTLELSVVGVQ